MIPGWAGAMRKAVRVSLGEVIQHSVFGAGSESGHVAIGLDTFSKELGIFRLFSFFTIRSTLIAQLVLHNRAPSLGSVICIICTLVRKTSLFNFAHNRLVHDVRCNY
jgi:hypothetical protein